jgi:RNA polymerase-associated protein LEO1
MGMQSETHQMLVRAVGQKHNRVARLKMAPDPIIDPEREKLEQLKTQSKKPRKRREKAEDAYGTPIVSRKRTGFLNRKRASEKLWSDDEEEEPAYGSEGSDEEHRARTTRAAGKHMGEYQTDDFVVSDEDDEGEDGDGAGGSGRRKKRRSSDAEEEARDSLDEMEEKIEAESKRRKKRPGAEVDTKNAVQKASQEEEGEPEMDLESEEEDEEQVIRRRKSSRPKVIVEEEDEE